MHMFSKHPLEPFHKSICNMKKLFSRYMLPFLSNLEYRFFWTGHFIFQQIFHCPVSFRMAVFLISGILPFYKIAVMVFIIHLFNIMKTCFRLDRSPISKCLIRRVLDISPVTVPIDILLFPLRINMLAVGNIEFSVIVLWIINTMFPRSAIMPCSSHFSDSSFHPFCIFSFFFFPILPSSVVFPLSASCIPQAFFMWRSFPKTILGNTIRQIIPSTT